MDNQTRAVYARQLIDNPMFQEAFKACQDGVAKQMLETTYEEKEARDALYLLYHAYADVMTYLTQAIETGKLDLVQAARKGKVTHEHSDQS